MKRLSPNGPIFLLAAVALTLPLLAAPPAVAGTIGGAGGEIAGYRYELYLKREAEAQRKKELAQSGVDSGTVAQPSTSQKAGIGLPDFSGRPALAPVSPAERKEFERGQ